MYKFHDGRFESYYVDDEHNIVDYRGSSGFSRDGGDEGTAGSSYYSWDFRSATFNNNVKLETFYLHSGTSTFKDSLDTFADWDDTPDDARSGKGGFNTIGSIEEDDGEYWKEKQALQYEFWYLDWDEYEEALDAIADDLNSTWDHDDLGTGLGAVIESVKLYYELDRAYVDPYLQSLVDNSDFCDEDSSTAKRQTLVEDQLAGADDFPKSIWLLFRKLGKGELYSNIRRWNN